MLNQKNGYETSPTKSIFVRKYTLSCVMYDSPLHNGMRYGRVQNRKEKRSHYE
jgi:hypothetical protein